MFLCASCMFFYVSLLCFSMLVFFFFCGTKRGRKPHSDTQILCAIGTKKRGSFRRPKNELFSRGVTKNFDFEEEIGSKRSC